jgi:hypothetical protein
MKMVYKLLTKRVKVPLLNSRDTNLCWETWHGVNQYEATSRGIDVMEHCTLIRGHDGKHTFERVEAKQTAN